MKEQKQITITYDYTGRNCYAQNYTKTFESKEDLNEFVAKNKPFIWGCIEC